MKYIILLTTLLLSQVSNAGAVTIAVNELKETYRTQGASIANLENGQKLWNKIFTGTGQFNERSCSSCHTDNLKNQGKHIRTGKVIKPLAPSTNPETLTNIKNIKKWFKRNCKWTIGRECNAQEKMDILEFISKQ